MGARGMRPDPAAATNVAEYTAALEELRIWAGAPSLRTLAKLVGPLLRPPRAVTHSTVADVFKSRRRRLDVDLTTAIVRALGLDESEAATWRSAYVRLQAAAKAEGEGAVLRQLPAELPTFTGREAELKQVIGASQHEEWQRPSTVLIAAVEGMGGVGKTQLVIHAAHELVRAGRFTDLQLFANLRGHDPYQPPADPAAVLGTFLRQLGVPDRAVPESLSERSAMYRDRMDSRAALVVLDNAVDEAQVQDLIPASPTCMVLVTSRRSLALPGVSTNLVLESMPEDESVRLLAEIAGADRVVAEPESAARIVALCGGLPLALSMIAARLRSRPAWTVTDLTQRLEQDGVDALSMGDRSLRRIFDLSYRGLPSSDGRMFALLGLHTGEDFSCEAAAALAGVDWAQARRTLESLQDEHLVQQRSRGRYSLHDLLRDYAAGIAVEEHDAESAVHRMLMFYLDSADRADRQLTPVPQGLDRELPAGLRPLTFRDREQALRWFDAEYHNLLGGLRTAAARGNHAIATDLPIMLGGYFALRVNSADWIAALQIALESATKLDDTARLGGALNRLGGALTEGGRHNEAADALRRAVELGRTLDDGLLWTVARTNLAVVQERLGNLEDASRLLREALPDQRRIANRVGEGVALENLGKISLRMAQYHDAIQYCGQAIEIYGETCRDSELVNALNIIGQAYRKLGRLPEAESSHRQALEYSLAMRSPRGEGQSLHQLGLALMAGGEGAVAARCLDLALEAYTAVGDPRKTEVVRVIEEHRTLTGTSSSRPHKP